MIRRLSARGWLVALCGLALGSALAGVFAAVASDDAGRPKREPADTAPTSGAPPSTSPSPPSSGLDDQSKLRLDGVGPITFGMTIPQATEAARTIVRQTVLPACVGLQPVGSPQGLDLLVPGGTSVQYAVVKAPPITTEEAVGVGSLESHVLATYPTAQVRNPGEQVHRIVRFGEATARGRVMVFEIQDGVVAAMWSGPLDAADTDEICS